jgi:RNA polymerase sigma factor (TIGR02999 family)
MSAQDAEDVDVPVRSAQWTGDEPVALDQLFPVVYDELRRVAHRQLRDEATGHTLGTTALVHEVYLRLAGRPDVRVAGRRHFFALAATAMRHVLIDCARRYRGARRGHGEPLEQLSDDAIAADVRADELLALDEALSRLAAVDPRLAQVVECRFFAGLSEEETGEAMGLTARTVRRDWVKAKGWLYRELST